MTDFFPFQGLKTDTDILKDKVIQNAEQYITDLDFIRREVNKFLSSEKRKWMVTGKGYYLGEQDILLKKRTYVGDGGVVAQAMNLPNSRIVDNQYAKLVDQKVNYQVGQPFTIDTENEAYREVLENVFDKKFNRKLKELMTGSLNFGLNWLYVYYNRLGELAFKVLPAYEMIPFYDDEDELESAIRVYKVTEYEGLREVQVTKIEVYTLQGIEYYVMEGADIIPDVTRDPQAYIRLDDGVTPNGIQFNWSRIPLIPFRFNMNEVPLIQRTKSIQDAINEIVSNFQNNMLEDPRSTFLILKNYDGQDLGELKRNLATYGIIKVRADGTAAQGGVETLEIKVDASNYEAILKILKRSITENGRGFDGKDDRLSGNPNQMNIQAMYADIELDANGIETEFQAAFEELLWFIDQHIANTTGVDFESEKVEIIFNKDMLSNELEIVEVLEKSPYLPLETRLAQHPYVRDVQVELDRLDAEEQKRLDQLDQYAGTFQPDENIVVDN